ncbi:transcriptional regulator [Pseudomonas aeruginosa]|uniref:Transcriptional regulator n=4 Tax=Gammaproteobacteria TaxID=1236 RepID=A0A241XE19_PSEAI|nr:transcriptional regulator [Pseudomonas aeruginosa]RMJ29503.1 transcriptional regulator [Pseudomonas aeruginosa 39016]OKR17025.1 transcriptional regulator [Pseudomonas aeruginosa]OKR50116.1 transcriptional regulator [Pseudomonas aeruginosa]OKR93366.1 transcriptional regulator [Pseudomonas aeruginosa]
MKSQQGRCQRFYTVWAISGRREDFPQPAVRCGTDGLRAGVVNPPGLTCAALPLTSEGRQRIKR